MRDDRETARDLVLAIEWHIMRCDDNDDYKECEKVAAKVLAAARAQGIEWCITEMTRHARLDSTGDEMKEALHIVVNWVSRALVAPKPTPDAE